MVSLGLVFGLVLNVATETPAQPAATVDGDQRWIVVMHDPRSARRRSGRSPGYAVRPRYDRDPRLLRAAARLAEDFMFTIEDQWPIRSLNVHCLVARLPESDVQQIISRLREDARVSSVQRLNLFASLGSPDPYRELQSGLQDLGATGVHPFATGAGVEVSVVDSGIDAEHPDLNAAVVLNENFVDDAIAPAEQHGTGVAGVIAARADNGVGVTGVAPGARLQALRACWQDGVVPAKAFCNTLTLSRALDRVVDLRPRVLNLSLSGPSDPLLERLLDKVLAQGTIVVTAYDESRPRDERFPRAREGVLTARTGEAFSDSGGDSLPAPGTDVLTAQPAARYDVLDGNSLSAAHVSGAAALLLQREPALTPQRLATLLRESIQRREGRSSINACRAYRQLDRSVSCTSPNSPGA